MVADLGSEMTAAPESAVRIRRNVLTRIKLGHVVMALAALFALVLNLAVLRGNQATAEIAVAAADIRAGATLTASHLTIAEVPADDSLVGRFVLGASIDETIGKLVTRPVAAGDPILETDLRSPQSRDGLRAMSIPIDQTQAVAGHLAAGDSVDIVLVVDGVATYIVTAAEVLDVPGADSNVLGARSGYAPTVSVDATEALRIAAALDTGEVHIVRSTGSALPDLIQARAVDVEREEGAGG